jgi:hypothetical protein
MSIAGTLLPVSLRDIHKQEEIASLIQATLD